jgi:hypothetical protein
MRRYFALAAAAALLASCASHKTVTYGGTTVTTNGNGQAQTTTISNGQGTVTAGKNAVNPASLGLPVYPGSSVSENGGYSAQTQQGSGAALVMTTTDSFDSVYNYYKAHMPAGSEQMHMTAGNSEIAEFQVGKSGDKTQKAVEITAQSGKTTIMLTSATKP